MARKIPIIFFVFFIAWTLILPAQAAEFDPNYLISDTEVRDYNSLDLSDIQNFLEKRDGTLKSYITLDKENQFKTATQTFYEVAQRWRISPKYLLVLVQKEMSLLEEQEPKQTQYDWATGYGCFDGQACDTKYQGFYKQVNSAAAQTDYYLTNIQEFNYRPGKTSTIDGYRVTPKNNATAGLYNYTPHVDCNGSCGGNKLFWNLWNKYFGKKWPDGSLLQATSTDKIYLIADSRRREIMSRAVLLSRFDVNRVIAIGDNDLDLYDEGVPIKYVNFSLLQSSTSEDIFMIVDDQKRKIENQKLFIKIGFKEDDVTVVSQEDLDGYKKGPDITEYTLYPAGALLQDTQTKEIFYLINSKKRLVTNDEIMKYNFHGMPVKKISHLELDNYRPGNPVALPDGLLIKIKKVNTVYVIANGKRLPIFSGAIFKKMGYQWKNVIVVSPETLDVHPVGQTITGDW